MPVYRVSVWTSVEVEANDEEEACDKASDAVLNQEIKMRNYEFEAELTDHDEPER